MRIRTNQNENEEQRNVWLEDIRLREQKNMKLEDTAAKITSNGRNQNMYLSGLAPSRSGPAPFPSLTYGLIDKS